MRTTYLLSNCYPHLNTASKVITPISYVKYSGDSLLAMDVMIYFVASSKCVLVKARVLL